MKSVTKVMPNGYSCHYTQHRKLEMTPPRELGRRTQEEWQSLNDYRGLKAVGFHPVVALEEERRKAESQGLSKDASSPQKRRHVSKLSSRGRTLVESALAILERLVPRQAQSFLTLTLPGIAVERSLSDDGALRRAVRRFRKLLEQKLRRAGLPAHIVVRPEAHPERSERMGVAVPHWHIVCVGRRAGKAWAFDIDWVQETWRNALLAEGLVDVDTVMDASTNVQPVKKSLRRYMSKYLSKKCSPPEGVTEEQYWCLMPGTAYNLSRSLHGLVKRHTVYVVETAADVLWATIKGSSKLLVRAKGEVHVEYEDGFKYLACEWAVLTDLGMKKLGLV